jgi:hypothetical protein
MNIIDAITIGVSLLSILISCAVLLAEVADNF